MNIDNALRVARHSLFHRTKKPDPNTCRKKLIVIANDLFRNLLIFYRKKRVIRIINNYFTRIETARKKYSTINKVEGIILYLFV